MQEDFFELPVEVAAVVEATDAADFAAMITAGPRHRMGFP
jgi:hypothetical protein